MRSDPTALHVVADPPISISEIQHSHAVAASLKLYICANGDVQRLMGRISFTSETQGGARHLTMY